MRKFKKKMPYWNLLLYKLAFRSMFKSRPCENRAPSKSPASPPPLPLQGTPLNSLATPRGGSMDVFLYYQPSFLLSCVSGVQKDREATPLRKWLMLLGGAFIEGCPGSTLLRFSSRESSKNNEYDARGNKSWSKHHQVMVTHACNLGSQKPRQGDQESEASLDIQQGSASE